MSAGSGSKPDTRSPTTDNFILRFPSEILGEIFDRTLPHTRRAHEYDLATAPWRLAAVCQQWRICALEYKRLWSFVQIDAQLADYGDLSEIYPLAALETQLLRSADTPLEVLFHGYECHYDGKGAAAVTHHSVVLLDLLIKHSERWESFSFTWRGGRDDDIARRLAPIRGRLPLLRRLEFRPDFSYFYHEISISDSNFFAVAPCLRQILLTEEANPLESPTIIAPWAQITRLRAKLPQKRLLEYLQAAPNLVECALAHSGNTSHFPPPVVRLSHLHRLRVLERHDEVLRLIQTPQLHSLRLKSPINDTLLPFLRRSGCQLTELVVDDCIWDQLPPLLHTLPSLSSLRIIFQHSTEPPRDDTQIFTDLTLTSNSGDLCPNLASIQIKTRLLPDVHYDEILRMVQSRWRVESASVLNFVRIVNSDWNPCGVPRGFRILREQGLDITINGEEMAVNSDASA
ncbi:hypothetical protein C8R43DRAFT_969243 [Mycena crocata]|nr:hypothetical protein C8R43DRAFT_969243 [Mycena crocata]